ncbi:MAG: bifunctional riboflavin kinase/FAD synthetase [Clostridiales bacterium]|nr:bifunctional riboflavin kinase/FAD synthetase [Clostridiales bacterium]
MQVVFNIDKKHTTDKPIAMALGSFDGVHVGHQMLIQQLKYIQNTIGCCSLVYTFLNNPLELLNPKNAPSRIMTLPEKISKFNRFNIDYLVLNPFNKCLASMPPQDFIEHMLIKNYNLKYIVVGYDFKFGTLGSGNVNMLKEFSKSYGYEVIVVPPLSLGNEIVSSSLIRQLIKEGDVEKASLYLGSPYAINGKVVHGFGRGRKLGYPTANLEFDTRKAVPKNGIYLTRVKIEGVYYWGMTNVGTNPTFNNEGLFVETYILDYNNTLYDTRIKLEFLKRIRDEKKFSNVEDLKNQIAKDVQWAKNYIYKFI